MHLWLKCPITQPLFCPIFSNFHILYSFLCTIHRYITQIMHLSKKYRKTHLNSCNFTGENALITIISLVRLCMHLWLKCPITQPLFCPIFLNFHILYSLYVLSIDTLLILCTWVESIEKRTYTHATLLVEMH